MKTYYLLSLSTDGGKKRSIRINEPGPGLSNTAIEEAIDDIIDNDVFNDTKGKLDGFDKMEQITIERTVLL